ncbi:MAG: phage tail tape measure C-terminal domain-containing protein [Pseudomonadota bacterium]
METNPNAVSVDLTGLTADLDAAGAALSAFAAGPAQSAALDIETSFERVGGVIEQALRSAARSGELDFQQMVQSILSELARIAVEAAFPVAEGGGASGGASPFNITLNMNGGGASDVLGSTNQIAAAVALAAQRGSRFL